MKKRIIVHNPDLAKPLGNAPVGGGPSIVRQAQNLTVAVIDWSRSGFKLADDSVISHRETVCLACEYWDSSGNAGLGKCRHMNCGCTRAKWKLATSQCPLDPPRWKRVDI